MKMSRADKRRRRIAKMVEMKLDGMTDVDETKHLSFEDLYRLHAHWKKYGQRHVDYYNYSMADVLNAKGRELQRDIDRRILEELTNGKPK